MMATRALNSFGSFGALALLRIQVAASTQRIQNQARAVSAPASGQTPHRSGASENVGQQVDYSA